MLCSVQKLLVCHDHDQSRHVFGDAIGYACPKPDSSSRPVLPVLIVNDLATLDRELEHQWGCTVCKMVYSYTDMLRCA